MSQETMGIIEKRMAVFHYIFKAHIDSTSNLLKSNINTIYSNHSHQAPDAYRNFFLGCTVSTMIARYTSLSELLKALVGALKDYENLKKKPTDPTGAKRVAQVSKRIFRRSSYNLSERILFADKKATKGFAMMINTDVSLSHLIICHLPCPPDALQTFLSLCESFMQCYRILESFFLREIQANGPITRNHELHELLQKFDSRVNKCITAPMIREIDELSRSSTMKIDQGLS